MKKVFHTPIYRALPALIMFCYLLFFSQQSIESVLRALELCFMVVIPSLFPFFVLSQQLVQSGFLSLRRGNRICYRLFGVPAAGITACIMGLCSGYPVGIQTACALYQSQQLTRSETQRLICFCNCTGPAFIFGMIRSELFSAWHICLALYLLQIVTVFLAAVIQRPYALISVSTAKLPSKSVVCENRLAYIIRSAFQSVLNICSYVVFFSVVVRAVQTLPVVQQAAGTLEAVFGLPREAFAALPGGLLDLTNGIASLSVVGNLPIRFVLCACFLSWGGICVHFQAVDILQKNGFNTASYYRGKLLQTALTLPASMLAAAILFSDGPSLHAVLLVVSAIMCTAFFIRLLKKRSFIFRASPV